MNINNNGINKQRRPKLNIPRSNLERILGFISLLGTIIIWIYFIASWKHIPHQVPTHFGALGKPDSWGEKKALLFLPIVQSVLYPLLTITSKFPQHYNYLTNITEENAERQYQNARTLILWLSAEITVLFLFLEYQSIKVAMNYSTGLAIWFLPVFLLTLFGTLGLYIYRMFKLG